MNEINVTLKMNQTNLGTYCWRISLGRRQVRLKIGKKPAGAVSPAIVLRPDIVAPFARVVESETDLGSG